MSQESASKNYNEAKSEIFAKIQGQVLRLVEECNSQSSEFCRQPWMRRIFGFYEMRLHRIAKKDGGTIGPGIRFIDLYIPRVRGEAKEWA
jgi:hypothetical protein